MIISKKIKLIPVGSKEEISRVYNFIREGQYAQYRGLNLLMGQLCTAYYMANMDIKSKEFKEKEKEILINSNTILDDIEFAKGLDTKSAITQKVKSDFYVAVKNGLAKGERTITNYKRTVPLISRSRLINFYHTYDSDKEFEENLFNKDLEVFIKWVNKIVFKVVLGNPYRSRELRITLNRILKNEYVIKGSSLEIKDNKIFINLSLDKPVEELNLSKDTSIGVCLGYDVPIVCSCNKSEKIYKVGDPEYFLSQRFKIQNLYRKIQQGLKYSRGGHGRSKKLKALRRYKSYEKNFVKTYNHSISKQIIDIAIKNNAKNIILEEFTKSDIDKIMLRNWSYHQLQQYIEYKAKQKNILVKYNNSMNLDNICSECGCIEENDTIDINKSSKFICKNCSYETEYNYNKARNLAKIK